MNEIHTELFRQAMKKELTGVGTGVYSALPNEIGRLMGCFKQLCKEHGIDPKTGNKVEKLETSEDN